MIYDFCDDMPNTVILSHFSSYQQNKLCVSRDLLLRES